MAISEAASAGGVVCGRSTKTCIRPFENGKKKKLANDESSFLTEDFCRLAVWTCAKGAIERIAAQIETPDEGERAKLCRKREEEKGIIKIRLRITFSTRKMAYISSSRGSMTCLSAALQPDDSFRG